VYSRLLTVRWVLLHLLVLALFVATFFLGNWQLGKAEGGGGAVNWSYALQWPLYGFMGLGFYLRMLKDELNRDPADDDGHHAVPAEGGGGAVNWSYALQWPLYGFMGLGFYLRMLKDELNRDPADDEPGNSVVLYQRPRIDTTGDPELAAYNAYLAELNAKALGQETPRGR
jgi:DNA-binding transcriptional regulator of glucitol operon